MTTFASEPSAGASRYGNVRAVVLPDGSQLRFPTSRSTPSIGGAGPGVAPTITLARDSAVHLAAALQALRRVRGKHPPG